MGTPVLVVDDSMMVRQKVSSALGGTAFEVVEAEDGVQAIARLAQRKDIGLVICDVNMPRVNGIQLAQHMARTESLAHIPVLMLSSSGGSYDLARAKGIGVKAWVLKPFDAESLLATVEKLTAHAA
jgi:two-component system chemotaxis response regulator CheY